MVPMSPRQDFDARVQSCFVGREDVQRDFAKPSTNAQRQRPLWNIHGVTGTGKSFLLHRFLNLGQSAGLKTVKVQFDGKDREVSVGLGQHQETSSNSS